MKNAYPNRIERCAIAIITKVNATNRTSNGHLYAPCTYQKGDRILNSARLII
ncbi:MAG: hypothetical protein V7K41_21605 [Nostoc sp.]|uniref:hypothetical protein n=1 Tax=Nostoc sp. TaxID=1180 RepID=UPI002FF4B419